MPSADVGAGAEIEPGSVVTGAVPAGERWSGSPAVREGEAGVAWPDGPPGDVARRPAHMALYALGLGVLALLPLLAALPGILLLSTLGSLATPSAAARTMLVDAPVVAASFIVSYAVLTTLAVRSVSWLVRPGWHPDMGATAWALWFSEAAMARTRGVLFPLYLSVYTRTWLRLLGVRVGKRTEISTFVGLNRLVSFAATSFSADDVTFAGTASAWWMGRSQTDRGRQPYLPRQRCHLAGRDTAWATTASWGYRRHPRSPVPTARPGSGCHPSSSPGRPSRPTRQRTTAPPARLVLARAAVELVRILLPTTVSVLLAALVFDGLESIGTRAGGWALLAAAPFAVLAAGLCAVATTIGAKWLLMGRYKPGAHPFWSFFVWRDEIINTCQEQLAEGWLLSTALGTPLVPAYIRAMGGKVGRGVWFESLNITEFDLVDLGDGCNVNRGAVVETHLVHDRVLSMGPAVLGCGSTLGPNSAVLPDTVLGAGCTVGATSVVLRGERLPPHTSWHGVPVQSW